MDIEKKKRKLSSKTFSLTSEEDLVAIREFGRSLANKMGFSKHDQTVISTAISEICRNVIEYAGEGVVTVEPKLMGKKCINITVEDSGPGIKNVEEALQEGFSSGKGLGIGLPGAKRIMDEFEIETGPQEGTTIKMCKLLNKDDSLI